MPEVLEFSRMAGEVDYMLRVVAPDIEAYDAFYKRLTAIVPLRSVASHFVLQEIKSTTALPLGLALRGSETPAQLARIAAAARLKKTRRVFPRRVQASVQIV